MKRLLFSSILLSLWFCGLSVQAQRMVKASPHIRACEFSRGFTLLAGEADRPVVLGYSDESSFDQARLNPAFNWMLERMEQQLSLTTHRAQAATFGPIYKPTSVREAVLPLTNDLWHQYASPYFDACPKIDGESCAVGCVATALAQLMHFHRWPLVGKGSHSYEDTDGCGQTLSADFSTHHYDWEHMLDVYEGSYTQRQADAVSLLMSDCGIAVNMKYGIEASAARAVYQPQALVNYFDYDPGMMMRYRSFYTQVEWDSIMFCELDAGRPMIVSAWEPNQGHSFICDGYDADGFFHINFGNEEGYGNGYYYFTFLTPDMPEWHHYKDNPETGFNLLQCILTGVQPRLPQPSRQQYLYAFSHLEDLDPTTVVVHNLCNIGWNKHEGRVGLALQPGHQLVYNYTHDFLLEEVDDTTYTDTITLSLPSDISDGTYRLVPVYDDGGTWVEARTQVGTPNYLQCTVQRGAYTLSPPASEAYFNLKVVGDPIFPEALGHWTRPDYYLTFRNDGSEYSGRIYVALYTDDAPNVNHIIAREGLSIHTGETVERPFTETVFRNPPEGIYHLRILADIDLFTDSLVTIYDNPSRSISVVNTLPDDIEAVHETASEHPSAFYDLLGRPLPTDRISAKRKPVIVVQNGKTHKILR